MIIKIVIVGNQLRTSEVRGLQPVAGEGPCIIVTVIIVIHMNCIIIIVMLTTTSNHDNNNNNNNDNNDIDMIAITNCIHNCC